MTVSVGPALDQPVIGARHSHQGSSGKDLVGELVGHRTFTASFTCATQSVAPC